MEKPSNLKQEYKVASSLATVLHNLHGRAAAGEDVKKEWLQALQNHALPLSDEFFQISNQDDLMVTDTKHMEQVLGIWLQYAMEKCELIESILPFLHSTQDDEGCLKSVSAAAHDDPLPYWLTSLSSKERQDSFNLYSLEHVKKLTIPKLTDLQTQIQDGGVFCERRITDNKHDTYTPKGYKVVWVCEALDINVPADLGKLQHRAFKTLYSFGSV